jgi:hypothetical protein
VQISYTDKEKYLFAIVKYYLIIIWFEMNVFQTKSLNFHQIIVAVVALFFFVSIAGLGTMSLLRGPPAAWDGVINPRHNPAAIHGMEDVEQDAR